MTTYGFHDIKAALSMPRKKRDRRDVCKAEEAALLASSFNVKAQVERELAEHDRLAGLGFGENSDAVRLLKHVHRKLSKRKAG